MKSVLGGLSFTAEGAHRLERRHGKGTRYNYTNLLDHSNEGHYNIYWNIASVFIVFVVSTLGCGFTVAVTRIPRFKIPMAIVDMGRHFGTGVILSTAFAHMLVHAMHHLLSPEVPNDFPSSAAVIAVFAALTMHILETTFASQSGDGHDKEECHHHILPLKRRKLTTYILELGILSHSVFVGISLGLKKSEGFTKILIAVCFHQFFEGVGLGARIADIHFENRFTPFLMIMAYSITTSIGILLGIGIHSTYDPHSSKAIIAEGCLDAISAGILIYTGIVELLGRDLSRSSDFSKKSSPIKLLYLTSLYVGALSMLIIANWV